MSARSHPRLALVALLAGATGIGFAPVLVRLTQTGPSATAFYRVLFALPLLWLWALLEQRAHPQTPRPSTGGDFLRLALGGLFFAGDLSIWHWSLRFTSVANSTLLANVAPLFVTLGAWFILREPVSRPTLVGLGLALAGGALLAGASARLSQDHLFGDFLAIVAAVFYAGYLLLVKQLRRSFSTPTIMAWSGLVSGPAFALIGVASGDVFWTQDPRSWLALGLLALVCHVGGQTLIAYGFGHLPASFSSVSLLWQPVVAAAMAWLCLQERTSALQVTGGIVVLTGITVASRWRPAAGSRPRRENCL